MNALLTITVLLGLVLCASAQFGFNQGFGRGPTVTKTINTETRPGFGGNNGFNGGFNNGFNGGFNRGPGGFHRHGPFGRNGFNNGFNGGFNNGPTVTRTITEVRGGR